MLTVTVRNMRLNLSKYLHLVEDRKEEIIVRNRNKAVARIVPMESSVTSEGMENWLKNLGNFRNSVRISDSSANKDLSSEMIIREDRDTRG